MTLFTGFGWLEGGKRLLKKNKKIRLWHISTQGIELSFAPSPQRKWGKTTSFLPFIFWGCDILQLFLEYKQVTLGDYIGPKKIIEK